MLQTRFTINVFFFNNLNSVIENYYNNVEQKIVLGGDFNVALSTDLDCSGGNPIKRGSLSCIFDVVDIWRARNPDCKRFTWRQKILFIQ